MVHVDANRNLPAAKGAPSSARTRWAVAAAVLLSAGALVAGWLVREQWAAREEAARTVQLALGQVQALRAQALALPVAEAERSERDAWRAAERVERALENGAVPADIRAEAQEQLDDLRRQIADAEKDRRVLHDLDAARELTLDPEEADFLRLTAGAHAIVWGGRSAAAFARAFQDYGIDVATLTTEQAAEQMRARRIRDQLVAGLEHWYLIEPTAAGGRLLDVANHVDNDPRLTQARAALAPLGRWTVMETDFTDFNEQTPNLPPATVLLLANRLHTRGEIQRAAHLLQRARCQQGGDFWLQQLAGRYAAAAGGAHLPEAARALSAAVALRPQSPGAWLHLGLVLTADRQPGPAVQALRRAAELKPNSTLVQQALVLALRDHGQAAEALTTVDAARRRHPDSPLLLTARGDVLRRLKRPVEAATAYQQALDREPRWYFALAALAESCDKTRALALLDQALQVQPQLAELHLARWRVLYDSGDYGLALAAADSVIRCSPLGVQGHYARGLTLLRQGKYAAAAETLQQAGRLAPDAARPSYELGSALMQQQQYAQAVTALEAAAYHHANFAAYQERLGDALLAQGRPTAARQAYQKAIALQPNAGHHAKLSAAYHAAGDFKRAQAEGMAALKLDPKSSSGHHAVGNSLLGQGRHAEAVKHYRQALADGGSNATIGLDLARALVQGGAFADAHAELAKAVELFHPQHPGRPAVETKLKECQRLLALDKQIQAFRDSGAVPKAAKDVFQLADLARRYGERHNTAVALSARILTAEANVIDELLGDHRYRAACSAALTAAGQAADLPKPAPGQKAQRRDEALRWLRAELEHCTKASLAGKSEEAPRLLERIARWQTAPQLESVREPGALAQLPRDEQSAWRELWDDAELFVKVARAGQLQVSLNGTLSPAARAQSYELNLAKGQTYVLDLESRAFDTLLQLHDADGKLLAENDDAAAELRNSRLVFTPPAAGVYRVIATTAGATGSGPYRLRIAALTDAR